MTAPGGEGTPGAGDITFLFDVISPYAYLASEQLEPLAARLGLVVRWRPIFLAGLQKALGSATILDVPAKARYVVGDSLDQAARAGVALRYPRRFPTQTLAAQRALTAAPEGLRGPFAHAVFRAHWAEGQDVGDPVVLAAALTRAASEAGLPAEAAAETLARANSPAVKDELRAATDEAQARGVFGVPTMLVGGKLFWGQDRLDTLAWYVARSRQGP